MTKKIVLILLFPLLFLTPNIYAQNKIILALGGGYISSSIDRTKLPYWENGYLISFSSDYNITNQLAIFFSSSFQKQFFNKSLFSITAPTVVGYRFNVNGENSTVIELSVGGKAYAVNYPIKPYIGIGAGVLFINQGKVELTNWMEGNPNKFTDTAKGINYDLAQFNFTLGLELDLVDNFQLDLNGKLLYGFGGPMYIPITASIGLGL